MDLTKIKEASARWLDLGHHVVSDGTPADADRRLLLDAVPDLLAEIERLKKGDEQIADAVREEIDRLAASGSFVINVSIGGMDASDPDFLANVRSAVEQGMRQAVADAKEGSS